MEKINLVTEITLELYRTYSGIFPHRALGGFDNEPDDVKVTWRDEATRVVGVMLRAEQFGGFYKTGYQDGFDDGLKCANECRSCEYIGKCEDDPQKTDYCPSSKLREIPHSP